MNIDQAKFLTCASQKLFGNNLKLKQKSGLSLLLAYWNQHFPNSDIRWLAYILGTAHHEVRQTLQPICEDGDDDYFCSKYDINGARPDKARELGNIHPGDGVRYHGRGFVQLTGRVNYTKWSERLNVDLVNYPSKALEPKIATIILFEGMRDGSFTGKKLADYFSLTTEDWINARRIVNGNNQDELVAHYARQYLEAIRCASTNTAYSIDSSLNVSSPSKENLMSKFLELVDVPKGINKSLSSVFNADLLSLLGHPSGHYNSVCESPDNNGFKQRLITRDVGAFKVSGFDLAVDSIQAVLQDVDIEQPELAGQLGTAGMLCCRFVKGSKSVISNHSWGVAIDLTIGGVLDALGDRKVQYGLTLIAPIFERHGWFWGAGFKRREDAMHFEISKEKILEWNSQGKLFSGRALPVNTRLRLGARGDEVRKLQRKLNKLGYHLTIDGIFGPATDSAVIAFQASRGLVPDGIVGIKTLGMLETVVA